MWNCFTVGKRLVKNESDFRKKIMMPNKFDILGVVKKNLGQARMTVKCKDGETQMCRVRGKMKKRRWVREDDIVLVSPWEMQANERGDIVFRYTQNQAYYLRQKGLLNFE